MPLQRQPCSTTPHCSQGRLSPSTPPTPPWGQSWPRGPGTEAGDPLPSSQGRSPPPRRNTPRSTELLAIYLGIKHFRHFLEGRSFAVYTDHKPLTFALDSGTDRSPRQSRHLSFIAEFTADIRHIKGTSNIVADMLSRPEPALAVSAAKVQAIDYAAMAEAQDAGAAQDTSLRLEKVAWKGVLLLCDSSTGTFRPLVPEAFRKQIFQAVHCLSHPGA